MKKLFSVILSVCILVGAAAVLPYGPFSIAANAAEPMINSQDVKIYALSEWAKEYISIPDEYDTEFKLTVSGAEYVTFRVTEGFSAEVSDDGVITPRIQTNWDGRNFISFGTSVITVTADGVRITVNVEVIDYASVYTDKVLDEFIAANVTNGMTAYDKICLAAKFAADHEYSGHYSSCAGMVITGGGDCWASTDAIIKICRKLGIEAWVRNGNRDYGAGSGHMNAIAYADGKYYEAEAGFYEPAPRYYYVKERVSVFSTRYDYTYGGLEVYQYDGKENPETLVVPDEIDGTPVVSIGESFISMESGIKEVVLPDSVKYIGKSAFNSCSDLQMVNIPASLVEMDELVFTNCQNLKDLTGGSDVFKWKDGGLIKDGTTLLFVPNAKSYVIEDTIMEIAPYAFYYNRNIRSVTIPSSVVSVGEGAFGDCTSLVKVRIEGETLYTLGDFAFAYANSLGAVYIPDSVCEIGENFAMYLGQNFSIICHEGTAIAQYAEENEIPYRIIKGEYSDFVKGDINGDGETNNKDVVTLFRYLSGEDLYVESSALDMNEDGCTDNKDVVALFRYCSDQAAG